MIQRSLVTMPSDLITKRALLAPQPRPSSSYTESKAQRKSNLSFDATGRKSKAARAATKRMIGYFRLIHRRSHCIFGADDVLLAKEFDSSTIISPLLDPRILERRVMAAKANDRTAQ
jgi:hypothetical protein